MTAEEAIKTIKASATDMSQRLELQSRNQIEQVIADGYLDPILDAIIVACERRQSRLASAASKLAETYA